MFLRTFRNHRRRSIRGFTLIELIVSITAGAVVSGSAAMLLLNASRFRAETSARAELVDMGSAGLEVMIRYIREIDQDECPLAASPCLNGNAQIDTANSSQLMFDSYGFRLQGGAVEITDDSGANWQPLIRNVSSLTFTYFNRTGSTLSSLPLSSTDRAAVRRVRVAIELNVSSESFALRTSTYLRAFLDEVMSDP